MASTSGPETVRARLKARLPFRFERSFDDRLHSTVENGRDAERPEFPVRLRDVDSSHRQSAPRLVVPEGIDQFGASLRRFDDQLVYAGSKSSRVFLGHSPHGFEAHGVTSERELLQ
jgi:hypothetical protein